MTVTVTHAKVVTTLDDGTSEVGSDEWNADHVITGLREVLAADRTYYVRTDGSDSNTGLADTAGGAFLTIQKAVNTVQSLDLNNDVDVQVTIQIADGTYTENVICGDLINCPQDHHEVAFPNSTFWHAVLIRGDPAAPGDVVINGGSGDAVTCWGPSAAWRFDGVTFTSTGSIGLYVDHGAHAVCGTVNYTTSGGGTVAAQTGSTSYATLWHMFSGTVTITGNWAACFGVEDALLDFEPDECIIVGTPTFSSYFLSAASKACVFIGPISGYTGTFTGKTYNIDNDGVILGLNGSSSLPTGTVAPTIRGNGMYTDSSTGRVGMFWKTRNDTTRTVLTWSGQTYTQLPTGVVGMVAMVTDSNTTTWGATIAGSGANTVMAFFNGTNWTVMGA
jgi:hypothetical protein